MLQIEIINRRIHNTPWIPKVCFFILGCLITYGLIHLHGLETKSVLDCLKEIPIDQYSPSLPQIVREVIVPPSELPYNLVNGNKEHSHGQAQLIKKLFQGMVGIKYLPLVDTDSS